MWLADFRDIGAASSAAIPPSTNRPGLAFKLELHGGEEGEGGDRGEGGIWVLEAEEMAGFA